MTSEFCHGLTFVALQGNLSATVSVALAFPILSQIIDTKNSKIIQECNRILRKNSVKNDRIAFLDMGMALNGYQFFLEWLSGLNSVLMIMCAIIGTFSFFSLVASTFSPAYCITYGYVVSVIAFTSLPFLFGLFYLVSWYDKITSIRAKIKYYDRHF